MIYYETTEQLMSFAKRRGIKTTNKGLLHFNTGKFTGRSPKDRYFVKGDYTNKVIDFQRVINQGIERESYLLLKNEVTNYLDSVETFDSRRIVGYTLRHCTSWRLKSSQPWATLFFNNMTIDVEEMVTTHSKSFAHWDIYHAPEFESDVLPKDVSNKNFVIIDFDDKKIIIAGTSYTGEIKKSIFTVMNTLLIDRGVLPMHCSANADDKNGIGVNLFFGLSGTGKTTLSSDLLKFFIGDDEHGWDGKQVFNFEGGCYAKLINLTQEKEPVIWDAMNNNKVRHNTSILENVIVDEDGEVDFTNDEITENIRVSYPLSQIDNSRKVIVTGRGVGVRNIFFLSFDGFGVLPPISRLTEEQAVNYFKLGYTSKVAGTEVGVTEPITTFSPCFGEPFLPRKIEDYTEMFRNKLRENPETNVWLVNTGFNSKLERFPLEVTRGIINGAIDGEYDNKDFVFYNELQVPNRIGKFSMDDIFEKPDHRRQEHFFDMIKNSH